MYSFHLNFPAILIEFVSGKIREFGSFKGMMRGPKFKWCTERVTGILNDYISGKVENLDVLQRSAMEESGTSVPVFALLKKIEALKVIFSLKFLLDDR